jgi:hypothetical protein
MTPVPYPTLCRKILIDASCTLDMRHRVISLVYAELIWLDTTMPLPPFCAFGCLNNGRSEAQTRTAEEIPLFSDVVYRR